MKIQEVTRWGVDFGNVLVQNIPHGIRGEIVRLHAEQNWSELDKLLASNSSLIPNAVEGLKTLITRNGSSNTWIVSRAAGIERIINRRLITLHQFEELTGLLSDHIFFVDKREEKASVCQTLGIQGHIDDRGEVLSHLVGIVPVLVWFSPSANDLHRWSPHIGPHIMPQVIHVHGWNALIARIT